MFPLDELELSDHLLVDRARQRPGGGIEPLFQRYDERVRQYAYRIVLEHHAADDVAQETFIRAARKLDTLAEGQAFAGWLFTIASNVARDHLRKADSQHRRINAAAQEAPAPESSHAHGEDAARHRQARILRAMESLPPSQREAVALVYLEDCSHVEAMVCQTSCTGRSDFMSGHHPWCLPGMAVCFSISAMFAGEPPVLLPEAPTAKGPAVAYLDRFRGTP